MIADCWLGPLGISQSILFDPCHWYDFQKLAIADCWSPLLLSPWFLAFLVTMGQLPYWILPIKVFLSVNSFLMHNTLLLPITDCYLWHHHCHMSLPEWWHVSHINASIGTWICHISMPRVLCTNMCHLLELILCNHVSSLRREKRPIHPWFFCIKFLCHIFWGNSQRFTLSACFPLQFICSGWFTYYQDLRSPIVGFSLKVFSPWLSVFKGNFDLL